MSSSNAMLEASSVYFQYVNKQAAHVKIDHVSRGFNLGFSKSLISLVVRWLSTTGVLQIKIKRLWKYKDDFTVFL